MHQANLAEDREKSRRRGGVVITITSVSVPRSRGRHCYRMWRSAIHDNHTSDADAVLGCQNLLFQNLLKPVVITGGNPGSSGGFLLYKSYTFDGIWFQRARLTATTLRLDKRRLAHTSPTLPMANHIAISEKIPLSS
jgi:hypothetical protein